ncbi:MAG: hypothetical protein JOZ22_07370 [Acidobacteriia bacterium]|nr:hypothetical protein [Terriglobia bacterium]
MKLPYTPGLLLIAAALAAQTPSGGPASNASTPSGPALTYTAVTDNISAAKDAIRIDLFRWSTDEEREKFLAAWMNPGASASGRGGAGRGGRGARGGAATDAAAAAEDPAAAGEANPAGGRGGAGRGGRGGRGGEGAAAPKPTPEASLAAALQQAPTLGYLWSSEVAGYSVRYAARLPQPDGGERIILLTDRRLGAWNDHWKPSGPAPVTNYDFSLVELHLNATGRGEGRTSLTGKVTVDSALKSFVLEDYNSMPVILKDVSPKKAAAASSSAKQKK